MNAVDVMGWCAAALTLLTFAARDMALLRVGAPGADAAFIAYARRAYCGRCLRFT